MNSIVYSFKKPKNLLETEQTNVKTEILIDCKKYLIGCAFLVATLANTAAAQASTVVNLAGSVMVDPTKWINSVWAKIGPGTAATATAAAIPGLDLPGAMFKLGVALLIVGIVWSGMKIASTGSGIELKDFMIRLLLASALVFGGNQAGDWLRTTWTYTYEWGKENIAKTAIDEAASEITALAGATATIGLFAASAPVALEVINVGTGKNPGEAIKDAQKSVGKSIETIGSIIQFILGALAAIVGTYYTVVLVSGFTLLIASVLIPLSGAMVIFAGGASNQWFSLWFRSVSGSLIMVLLIPVVFAAALDFGFVQPAKNFTDGFKTAANTAQTGLDKLGQATSDLSKGNVIGAIQNTYGGIAGEIQAVGDAISASTLGLAASIIMLIIGIIFSVVIVYAAQNQIMGFIGGTFSGGKEGGAAGQQAMGSVGGAIGSVAGTAGSLAVGAAVTTANVFTEGGASKAISVARESGGSGGSSSPGGGGSATPGGGGGSSSSGRSSGSFVGSGSFDAPGGGSNPNSSKSSGAGFGTSNLKTGGGSSSPGKTGRGFGSAGSPRK
jgi:hypothetical protein